MDHNLFSVIPYEKKIKKLSCPLKATAYYQKHQVNLITGERFELGFVDCINSLQVKLKESIDEKRVIHFFYECGFVFEKLEDLISENDLLAIDIQYSESEALALKPDVRIDLDLKHRPDYFEYEKKFQQGYAELQKGNFYQFNLTEAFTYGFDKNYDAIDFISALWRKADGIGENASATYIGMFDKLFLSNSPESLFEFADGVLTSRPIKGTILKESDEPAEIEKKWKTLINDTKSQAELFMITDLIRNDLNRIDLPKARVLKKKAMLLVPKLIHQYSEISISLDERITLTQVIEKIFPGGSITGAPKKRVMQFLNLIEKRKRGFYCGSTVMVKKGRISASINIRSCEINFQSKELHYQSGGGITLLSDALEEFKELTYKRDSFIECLNP